MQKQSRTEETRNLESQFKELLQIETDTWGVYMLAAKHLKVTENELWILLEIDSCDEILCQADISRRLHIPAQTLNSSLMKMVRKGWIAFVPVKGSQKAKGVVLTEEGLKTMGPVLKSVHQAEMTAFGSLDPEEAEAMLNAIRLYLTRFSEEMRALFGKE